MLRSEIRQAIKDRLNLTSTTADTRINAEINQVDREITTAIGLNTSRQVKKTLTATIGSAMLTITGIEKVERIWIDKGTGPIILEQVMLEELRSEETPTGDNPYRYALYTESSNSVTVQLDTKAATGYTLYADCSAQLTDLTDSDAPAFPESFHDVIVEGVLIKEYRKMEKQALARDSELTYQRRLSDLRMFIAKSNFLIIRQGDKSVATRGRRWRLDSVFGRYYY